MAVKSSHVMSSGLCSVTTVVLVQIGFWEEDAVRGDETRGTAEDMGKEKETHWQSDAKTTVRCEETKYNRRNKSHSEEREKHVLHRG